MAHEQASGGGGTAALRELLLALERPKQPLDDAMRGFAAALTGAGGQSLAAKFLELQPQADALLRAWPEQVGAAHRWAQRESVALFLRALAVLVRAQPVETLALRIVRERHGALEKALSWSDKPAIEYEALELLTALARAGGAVARELVRLFNFQSAPFAKLAMRRMKKPEAAPTDGDAKDDGEDDSGALQKKVEPATKKPAIQIREAYVRFVLALTACPDKSVHRFAMKEGGVTASLFKSVDGDSVEMLSLLFAQLNALVLHNADVETKTKLVIFNGSCVHQLLPLLQSDDESIAQLALDVLTALFFGANALYVVPPKHALRLFLSKATAAATNTNESDEPTRASEQAYAVKVIRSAIVTIGVNEFIRSTHAQTLVTSLLTNYPGLAAEYIHALSIQLEPTPGYRWFCVASLVQKLLSCPLDAVALGLPTESGAELPSWCSSAALATRLVLPLNCRKELSRGIQHSNNLIVYNTLGVMEAALRRYQFVVSLAGKARAISPADLEGELRFLLPSPEALVSLLLKLCTSPEKLALIYVRALAVFRLYLECLPQAMSEVKLDVTKILAWSYLESGAGSSVESTAQPSALVSLISSEILRFLLVVDTSRLHMLLPPALSNKNSVGNKNSDSAAPRSKLLQLLLVYVETPNPAIQRLCAQVLQRTLLVSSVFGGDSCGSKSAGAGGRSSEEIELWLDGLRSGGSRCAEFVEKLVQHVLSDPFQYLAAYRRTQLAAGDTGNEALTLSPGTVALVEFFNSRAAGSGENAESKGGNTLSAFRSEATVSVFGTRVLLSLLSAAEAPQQLVALISTPAQDLSSNEVDSDTQDASTKKKRKRVGGDDEDDAENRACGTDAYELLARYCEVVYSADSKSKKPALKKLKESSKSGQHATTAWVFAKSSRSFALQLCATSPSAFAASWEQIVENCVQVSGSFEAVHHYLGSWVGSSLLDTFPSAKVLAKKLSSSSSPAKKAKKKKNESGVSAAAGTSLSVGERFQSALPLSILMQSLLFSASKKSQKEIEKVAVVLDQRISNGTLDAVSAARLCEQLLFALSHRHSHSASDSSEEEEALCSLLSRVLSFVFVSAKSVESTQLTWQIRRILTKLRNAAVSASRDPVLSVLGRKLAALEIASLRLFYSEDVALSTDASLIVSTLERSGIPSVALLSSLFPAGLRIRLLRELLGSGPVSMASVQGVLVQHVLKSLDDEATATYASFSEYKKHKLLARKLWRLLERAGSASGSSFSSSLYSSSFSVLGKLGGIQADVAHGAIGSTLVPIILRAAVASSSVENSVSLPTILRRITFSIRSDSASTASSSSSQTLGSFSSDLESAVVKELRASTAIAPGDKYALLTAVYDVFTRIESPELRSYASALVEECFVSLMEKADSGSDASRAVRLSFLRHALLERGGDSSVGHLAQALSSVFGNLSKQHPDGFLLSRSQQAALLLAMRSSSVLSVQSKLQESAVVFLVKCGLHALKTLSKNADNASAIAETECFLSTIVAVVDGVVSSVSSTTLRAILKALGPQFTRAQDFTFSSAAPFVSFAKLSGVFLKLSTADVGAREACEYDFADHLTAITENPLFLPCLENKDDGEGRLVLIRAVYWLVQLSGVYDRKLYKVLLSVYSMSLSAFDRVVRILFDKFDENAGISLAQFGFRFGASATTIVSEDLAEPDMTRADLVDDSVWVIGGGLEQTRIRATVDYFPLDREVATTDDLSLLSFEYSAGAVTTLADDSERREESKRLLAYDPAFLLPMLSHFISSSDLPDAALVQHGLLGIAVRATSSNSDTIREYAYGIVAHVHESLTSESSEFKAGRQIHMLLESFRNAIQEPLEAVSSVVTVFLNDAISILCRPVHAMYLHLNHFLLARPAIDINDVPMFYSLFNSRAPLTYKQERSWFLHTLRRGVCKDVDVLLLVRRHVLPIFMSFFGSELADEHTQGLVGQILVSCLKTESGASYLVSKAAIFEWIGSLLLRQQEADRKSLLLLSELFESALKVRSFLLRLVSYHCLRRLTVLR